MAVSFSIAHGSVGPRKVVIWVSGDLDGDTGRAVRARLAQAQRHARSDVILDLTGATFVDSVALGSIVSGAKAMSTVGKLRVISPAGRAARIFSDAGLEDVLETTPARRQAGTDRRQSDVPVSPDRRVRNRRRPLPNQA